MGFKLTRFDPNLWIRGREEGYDTDDVLVIDVVPNSIFEKLKDAYTIKPPPPPKVYIGCDYAQVNNSATTRWVMGSTTYITECLRKVCDILKVTTLRK